MKRPKYPDLVISFLFYKIILITFYRFQTFMCPFLLLASQGMTEASVCSVGRARCASSDRICSAMVETRLVGISVGGWSVQRVGAQIG